MERWIVNEQLLKAATGLNIQGAMDALERGADINAIGGGKTPFIHVVELNDRKFAEFLLKRGAEIDAKSILGETALIKAVRKGFVDLVEFLIEKGANIDAENRSGTNVLMTAINNGHEEIFKLLLDKGADIYTAKKISVSDLVTAINATRYEHKEVMLELLHTRIGNLEKAKREMKAIIKSETDPVKRMELMVRFARDYKALVSALKKEILGELRTLKLPERRKDRFRVRRVRNG